MNIQQHIESLLISDEKENGIDMGEDPSDWVATIAALRCAAAIDSRESMLHDDKLKNWLDENAGRVHIYGSQIQIDNDFLDHSTYDASETDDCLALAAKYHLDIEARETGHEVICGTHGFSVNKSLGIAILNCIAQLPKDLHELAQRRG